jgi:hypothetical protein
VHTTEAYQRLQLQYLAFGVALQDIPERAIQYLSKLPIAEGELILQAVDDIFRPTVPIKSMQPALVATVCQVLPSLYILPQDLFIGLLMVSPIWLCLQFQQQFQKQFPRQFQKRFKPASMMRRRLVPANRHALECYRQMTMRLPATVDFPYRNHLLVTDVSSSKF